VVFNGAIDHLKLSVELVHVTVSLHEFVYLKFNHNQSLLFSFSSLVLFYFPFHST